MGIIKGIVQGNASGRKAAISTLLALTLLAAVGCSSATRTSTSPMDDASTGESTVKGAEAVQSGESLSETASGAGTPISTEGVVQAAGRITAKTTRSIVLGFSAAVSEVHAEEGQRVKKGDLILTLDLSDYRQQVQDAEDKLAQSRQQMEASRNTLASAETELARAQAEYEVEKASTADIDLKQTDVEQAEEALKRAQQTVSDDKMLVESGAISKAEMDAATQRMEDAQRALDSKRVSLADAQDTRTATLRRLESGLQSQSTNVENQRISIGVQESQLKMAETDLADMQANLAETFLSGDGIVSDLDNAVVQDIVFSSGDTVPTNAKIVLLADMNSLTVEADVSEDFIKDVQIGARVEIHPLFDSGKVYVGTVMSMADMGVEKNGETFVATRISIDDPDEAVRPGFNVDVMILKK